MTAGHPSAAVPHAESLAPASDASLCRGTHYVFVRRSPATGLRRSALMVKDSRFCFPPPPSNASSKHSSQYVLNHSEWWFSRFSGLLLSCSGTHVHLPAVVYLFIPPPAHHAPNSIYLCFLLGAASIFPLQRPFPTSACEPPSLVALLDLRRFQCH